MFVRWHLFFSSLLFAVSVDALNPTNYPLSTRQALLQKADQLSLKGYSPMGWSNRAGTVLTPVHENGVYTADRPFYWNKIDVGCRSTVIELPSSTKDGAPDLWIHSPVTLDGPLKQALDRLGTVKHVKSPNYEHVSFASQYPVNYPDCYMWACPGLAERKPDVAWSGEIPFHYRPPTWKGSSSIATSELPKDMWDTDILQALHIDCEVNPFTGRAIFNEVIFYHAPTKTLLTTDLFWNYPASSVPNSQFGRDDSWELAPKVGDIPIGSRLWKIGMDKVYAPFFNNFMVTNKEQYRAIAEHILYVWDVETVIPGHGDILRGKEFISSVLKKHFQLE